MTTTTDGARPLRSRAGTVMVAIGAACVLGAVALGAFGISTLSDTNHERSAATATRRTRRAVQARKESVTRKWGLLQRGVVADADGRCVGQ